MRTTATPVPAYARLAARVKNAENRETAERTLCRADR